MPNEEIRNNIIKVARDVFSKYGFKKTTMDDIALAVRKGKSSIYYYFKSKEEIFAAVVDDEIDILRNELNFILQQEKKPQEKLKTYIVARMKYYRELVNFYNALKDEYLEQLSFIERIRKKYDEEENKMIKQILSEGIEKNVFNIDDLDMTTMAIVTAMKGIEYPLVIATSKDNLEKTIIELLNLLFYGIMKK